MLGYCRSAVYPRLCHKAEVMRLGQGLEKRSSCLG